MSTPPGQPIMYFHSEEGPPAQFFTVLHEVMRKEGLKPQCLWVKNILPSKLDTPLLVLGKPTAEVANNPNINLLIGPSVPVVMHTPKGLEMLRRAVHLWWNRVTNQNLVDPAYQYDLVSIIATFTKSGPLDPLVGFYNLIQMTPNFAKVYVDIETSGNIKTDQPEDTELISVSVLWPDTPGPGEYRCLVWNRAALADARCRAGLAAILAARDNLVGHNLQFDVKWLNNRLKDELNGKTLYPAHDTQLAHHVLFPGATGDHGLKELAQKMLGAPEWEADIAKYTKGKAHYELIPTNLLSAYNAGDVMYSWQVDKQLTEWVDESPPAKHLLGSLVIPATRMFVDIESTDAGWPVNLEWARHLKMKLTHEAEHTLVKLRKTVGDPVPYLSEAHSKQRASWLTKGTPLREEHEFNPGSWMQVKKWLATQGIHTTSTDNDHLQEILESGPPVRVAKFINRLITYRHTTKMLSTYVVGLLDRVRDGKVRDRYRVAGTTTGRLASTIHTVPRPPEPYREMYTVGDLETEVLIGGDFAQMETRCVAEICGDPQMIYDLQLDRPDFFDSLMPSCFPHAFGNVDDVNWCKEAGPNDYKQYRFIMKKVSHGMNYGRQPAAVAKELAMPLAEAQRLARAYFHRYPQLPRWQENVMAYVQGDRTNAKWGVPGLWTRFGRRFQQGVITEATEWNIKNSALAFEPQSTGSDICLSAAIEFHTKHAQRLQARVVGVVHDEIIVLGQKTRGQETLDCLSNVMTGEAAKVFHRVPFPIDGHIGSNWGSLK